MILNDQSYNFLYLTEILNDLYRNGFLRGGKAETMLKDWKRELTPFIQFPRSKTRKVFNTQISPDFW